MPLTNKPILHPRDNSPRCARWIMETASRLQENPGLAGDLEEEYVQMAYEKGPASARRWYRRQSLRSIPSLVRDSVKWELIMFKHYLKVLFRQLKKYPVYSTINIIGLALGLTVCLLVFTWVRYELSYDQYHEKINRMGRVWMEADNGGYFRAPVIMAPAGPALKEEFPEIEQAARLTSPQSVTVTRDEIVFHERLVGYADPELFEIVPANLRRLGERRRVGQAGAVTANC